MERFAVNSPEYREAFLKNLQGKELNAEERAAVVATAAIPTETANKIWGKMELYPILNAIDVMHIPGNVILPVEGTINAAGVVAMGTASTDSADTLAPVSLGAYKLIKTVEITADVKAMAIPAFEDWLVDRLANKLFRLVAAEVAAGTGTNEPAGLATITATGTYTKAAITYADLLTIIGSLPAQYDPNACFVMSRATFYGNVLNVTTTQKQPVVVADPQAPAKYNVFGFGDHRRRRRHRHHLRRSEGRLCLELREGRRGRERRVRGLPHRFHRVPRHGPGRRQAHRRRPGPLHQGGLLIGRTLGTDSQGRGLRPPPLYPNEAR